MHHDRGHRASCAGDFHQNGHVIVTNPNQLMSVNQQQHLQHQQRRRSSIHQSVIQHAPAAPTHQAPVQVQPPLSPESPSQQQPQQIQDVKVEITEVKP